MIEKTRQFRGGALAARYALVVLSAFLCSCDSQKEDEPRRDLAAMSQLNQVHECLAERRYDDAIAICEKAIAIKPDFPAAYHNMSAAYLGLKQYEDAVAACKKAIAIEPDYTAAFNNMFIAYRRLKRYDDVIAASKQLIAIKPDDPRGHYNLGLSYEKLGEKKAAIAAYEKTTALDPEGWSGSLARARISELAATQPANK
ncbi:MAG: tetratricopeptide repeat protein [Phycisphaerae bacterium]|jgi:tetratricopeptide (TPR) repeat protein|nr:tetratricopeptide repeat protein [Phycisphaerae bacterium]